MFFKGFQKLASTVVTMTPEEYFDLVHEKDPHVGALAGSGAGAAAGAVKGAKGKKHRAALIGAGAGALSGGLGGHIVGRGLKSYQAGKVRHMAEELKLKSTPNRKRYE